MKILSYGEDPMTLSALSYRLQHLLVALGDSSQAQEAVVLYRPSFGRKAFGKSKPSVFGEFDAIIGTSKAVYLIESKWRGSGEIHNGCITLHQQQTHRHDIMRFYLERWRQGPVTDWTSFAMQHRSDFEVAFPGFTMPTADTILARNLMFVLNLLAPCGAETVDVLLYLALDGEPVPSQVVPQTFRLISCTTPTVGGAGYFNLGSTGNTA